MTEHVYADIRVHFTRTLHIDETEDYAVLELTRVAPMSSTLTHDENAYIVEEIWESSREDAIINALLDAIGGTETVL